jgi:hypothetical protein
VELLGKFFFLRRRFRSGDKASDAIDKNGLNFFVNIPVIHVAGLPHELSIYWHQYPFPFGEFFCKFRSFLSEM